MASSNALSKRPLSFLAVLAVVAGSVVIESEHVLADPAEAVQEAIASETDASQSDPGDPTGDPQSHSDDPRGDDPEVEGSPVGENGDGAIDDPTVTPPQIVPDQAVLPRIVGGTAVKMSYAPWQVALIIPYYGNDFEDQICGGSIVSREWIVTAAHCVVFDGFMIPTAFLRVLAGSATLSRTSSSAVAVRDIVVHPGYDGDVANDIALIRLAQPLKFRKGSIEAIALPASKAPAGAQARITGWGLTWGRDEFGNFYNFYGSNPWPTALQGATVTVQADATCRDELRIYGADTTFNASLMLCAASPGWWRDTCQGDSGGPLATQVGRTWQLSGVTSWGVGCAWLSAGVYTNVAHYRSWIETTILLPGAPPSLSAPVRTADGYRFDILNHQSGFRYDVGITGGSGRVRVGRPSGGVLPVTVSRVAPGGSVTVRVATSRAEHITHSATVTANALLAGVRPVASRPVANGTGFTFQIQNYSPAYDYQAQFRSGSGTVQFGTPSGGVLPVTVTGVARGRSATVVITAVRSGHTTQSVTVKGSASR
jgi:hypothetical protein